MYQLTESPDTVLCTADGNSIPRGHRRWDEYLAWVAAGGVAAPVPPPYQLHSPAHYSAIRAAAWKWMTAWVQERRYDTVESCCSYANSTVARYRAEAMAMIQWRDDVNQALEAMVLAPPVGTETWEQVEQMLPQPEQYSWPQELLLPMNAEHVVLDL